MLRTCVMREQVLSFGIFMMMACIASAQAVSIGVKGGVPLTDALDNRDESRPYTIGPSIEIRLPAGFAIEAGALYRRIGNTTSFALRQNLLPTSLIAISFLINRQRGNSWEFPLLGKYYFRPRATAWQPFIATGYAFRGIWFHDDGNETNTDPSGVSHTFTFHNDYRSSLGIGVVAAAGIRLHLGHFAILPEFRYTRWGGSDNNQIRKNEAGFLLGVNF